MSNWKSSQHPHDAFEGFDGYIKTISQARDAQFELYQKLDAEVDLIQRVCEEPIRELEDRFGAENVAPRKLNSRHLILGVHVAHPEIWSLVHFKLSRQLASLRVWIGWISERKAGLTLVVTPWELSPTKNGAVVTLGEWTEPNVKRAAFRCEPGKTYHRSEFRRFLRLLHRNQCPPGQALRYARQIVDHKSTLEEVKPGLMEECAEMAARVSKAKLI